MRFLRDELGPRPAERINPDEYHSLFEWEERDDEEGETLEDIFGRGS